MQQFNLVLSLFLALCTIGCNNQSNTPPKTDFGSAELTDPQKEIGELDSGSPERPDKQMNTRTKIINNALALADYPPNFEQPAIFRALTAFILESPLTAIDKIIEEIKKGDNENKQFLTFILKILPQLPSPSDELDKLDGIDKNLLPIIKQKANAISEIPLENLFPMQASLTKITPEDWEKIRKFLPQWFANELKYLVHALKDGKEEDWVEKEWAKKEWAEEADNACPKHRIYSRHMQSMETIGLKDHYKDTCTALKAESPSLFSFELDLGK